MARFLIDVNLPYYFSLWHGSDFIHQQDINDSWPDEKIWEYAKANNLTIITKDSDFSNRILIKQPLPKVIHMLIGNLKMRDFFTVVSSLWDDVLLLNGTHKLVTVFKDRIEGIN